MTLWYCRLRKLEGYHFGVLCCAAVSATVLVINLVLTIWAVLSFGVQHGIGTLQDGSCKRTTTLTFWTHLAINILSTLLLGASNYSMQCLSSPTRSEIDKAHSQGIWLDIGVPSVRNLRRLSTNRIILWWLLAISSIPLHLLYNSAVFSSLCTRRYDFFMVSSEFFDGGTFEMILGTSPVDLDGATSEILETNLKTFQQEYQKNQSSLQRLEPLACLEIYSAPIISTYSDLFIVSTYPNFNNSLIALQQEVDSGLISSSYRDTEIAFDHSCRISGLDYCILKTTDPCIGIFANDSSPCVYIQHCLSERVNECCKLQFSLVITIFVIMCNLIKTICIGTIAWKQDPEPLVTLGDAISSFLDRPDVTTEGNCITGRTRFETIKPWESISSIWEPKRLRWFRAASLRRWLVCNIL